jgi:hypothetical protein
VVLRQLPEDFQGEALEPVDLFDHVVLLTHLAERAVVDAAVARALKQQVHALAPQGRGLVVS